MVTLKLAIAAVEKAPDGIIIVVIQEKMQVPVAEPDQNSDEMRMFKKMQAGLRTMGFAINMDEAMQGCPNNPRSFRTGFWMSVEDYEQLGRPTVGDFLAFNLTKEQSE